MFLLIGSVSATDINTNNTQIASTNGNEILSMENDVNILSAGEYTYTYLREQINSGGNITLIKGNYTYAESDGDTIEITTSRVIDGNGAVIDMAKSGHRAFYITTAGVTIKNLTIKNANYNDDGGAIYFNQLGTVENCNFTNNKATGDGGAVYFNEDGEVTNCNFTNNKATGDDNQGGAIMMYSGEVTNCNFINNTATRHGGAVFFYYDCNVTNCNFINNTATGSSSYGGAIYMSSGNVRNCNFTDNKATGSSSYGGAVYFENYAIVTNCNFTNNTSKDGGAVYIWKDCNVTNCNFTNNTASGNGGAIYFYNYYTKGSTVTNCNFTGNKAVTGSAIYFYKYPSTDTLTISNSIFLNNRANAKDLQVTKNENNITIIFTGQNNLLNAIYSRDDAEVTFTNVTYWSANGINNTGSSAIKQSRSNKEAGQNITIEIYDSNDKLVENVTLVTDNNGQTTYDLLKLNNGKYKYKAYHSEDYYYTYAKYNNTFTLGDFNSLQKYINGASENSILTLCRDYTFTPVLDDNITAGIVIDKQLTINGNGHTINALQKARIFQITAANVVLNNITFTNATYNGNGGAIYFSQSGTVENCNFTNNTATRDGGAIHFNYKSNVTNCNFTNNTATGDGGAIHFSQTGTVENCNFTNNKATKDGGAIHFSQTGTVENCNFTNNKATKDGGAIYFSKSGTVENCNFTANKATGPNSWGGAILMNSGNVRNCNFTANNATVNGGAISMVSGNVRNCNFTANTATETGGAIRMNSGEVTNCNFTANKATGSNSWGGAIYMSSGNVRNCNFTNNKATGDDSQGGAIRMNSGEVTNSNFTNNTASGNGGAIYFYNSYTKESTVTNCNFTNNKATENGGAIQMNSGEVTNCNFTGNKAVNGSAIYLYKISSTDTLTISNSIFLNNRANKEALEVTKNDNNFTITFTGQNNLLNAIYSRDDAEVTFTNVTYWSANGINNTGSSAIKPSRSNKEAGQNITIEIYDSNDKLVENVTLVTDNNGQTTYDILKLNNGKYKYNAYHSEDCYYTYAKYNDTITLDLGDFNRLQKYINRASENSILTLCHDYTFTPVLDNNITAGIIIDKQLTINGNGHTIDALQKARIFQITAANVVLNNITFTNTTYNSNGGAIYFSETGTVENCNFTNNTGKYGGAIHFSETGTVENCNFTNNKATIDGGAIWIKSGSVTNCNFTNNTATRDGGAIHFNYKSNITNCNFTNNTATGYGGAIHFSQTGTVENCNFTNNTATNGGAIHFSQTGTVSNCNFTNNTATENSGAILMNSGTVSNCNFTNNTATNGGAIRMLSGNVRNCNFTNNKATGKDSQGGAIRMNSGEVTNCNFTNNTGKYGGAVYFEDYGKMTNCNFTGNTATTGSAIYFYSTSAQSVSHSIFLNNKANAKDLQVTKNENNITIIFTGNDNLLNAIYSNGNVKFTNVTYWGVNITNTGSSPITPSRSNREAGQNITIKGVVNGNIINTTKITDENGEIVLDACDYLIIVSHKGDSYYTEVAETLFTNMALNVNVTNQTSNNNTVNITAKSNIPNEFLKGKLLFILPNGTEINANYTANGTWWALHTFDNAGDYNINATYIGLDDVTINNATISIRYDARVDVNNETLNLEVGQNFTIVANTTPEGINITYVQDDSGVYIVDKNGVVTALKNGTGSVLVKIGGDGVYAENSTIVNITVTKVPTEIKVTNTTLDLKVDGEIETGATLIPADAGNLTYTINNLSIVKIEDGKIIALKDGNAIITVSFKGNNKYAAAKNKTIKVTVKKVNTPMNVSAEDITEGKNATISVTLPDDVTGNVTTKVNGKTYFSPVENGKAIITIPDLEYGNYTLPVTYSGDDKYNPLTKDINLTVKEDEIIVSAQDLTKYYSGPEPFTVNVTYANGRAIAGKEVKITVNGVTYTKTTDENGTVSLNISQNVGTYDVAVEVDNITADYMVTVLSTINASDIESKTKTFIFTAVFIDGEGNYLTDGTNVSFNIKGVIYDSQVTGDKGSASINLTLDRGRYIITAYNPVSDEHATNSIAVNLKDVIMILSNDEITVGENATISITLPNDASGNVTATINGKTYTNHVNNGKTNIIIPYLTAGNYTVPVTYSGDDKYNGAKGDANVTVNKVDATITIDAPPITEGDNATVTVTLPEDTIGTVTIGNEVIHLQNGTASAILTNLPIGNITVPITYSGDDKYNPIETSVNVTVNPQPVPPKENLTISAIAKPITVGEDATIVVTGFKDATGNVTVTVGEGFYTAEIVNGTATVIIPGLKENTVGQVSYPGDNNYNNASTTVDIIVNPAPKPGKDNLTIGASAEPITVGDNATIVVTGLENATGDISVIVKGETYTAHIMDGEATVTIPGLTENVVAIVNYAGDDIYNPASTTVNITVSPKGKENTTIVIDAPSQATEGDNVTVSVTLPEDATGTVTIGNNVVPVQNGAASAVLTNIPAGNNTVPITYSGNDKYNPIETNVNIMVNEKPVPPKKNLTISASANPITVGEDAVIVVTGFEDATGNVTVTINGKTYIVSIGKGKATINVPGLTENATATVSYPGDSKYNNASTTVDIVVNPKKKENATMNIDVPPVTEGQNTTVNVELPKDATGNVTAVVDGKTYTAPVKGGKATITIPELAAGNYTVPVTYSGDNKYNSLTEEVKITVNEDKSDIIEAPDVTKYFSEPERFVVTVTDYQRKPLANKSVTISINGRSYDRTTDVTGTASIALGLNSGVYNTVVTVDNKTINSVVTILSTVNGTDIIKVFRNATQYYATFRDGEGNYLKDGETIIFNIHGVMYERKVSGDKGLAKLNINLEAGEYIITAMNPVTGDMTSNNITVLSRITENADLVKYYRNASQYTVKVIGDDGKAVGAGENVTFNINGVFYTRQTDSNGSAKLNINLQPGDYVITSEYKGCLVSNSIKVLPVLNAKDITMKYHDGTKFMATLVDGQGKAYADQSITFNINGVLYNRPTDSTGTSKLNINLMPGEYIITSSYNGTSIANKITIRG